MKELKISVVICAYSAERYKDTLNAVGSVLAQTLKPHQIIISIDHNEKLIRRFKRKLPASVQIVLNEGAYGLSETRNVGIRNSTGDIIVFMDDDAEAREDWLENYIPVFANPDVMAVGGDSIPIWPSGKQPSWFPEEFDWTIGCTLHNKYMFQKNGEIRNVTGSNMAFRSEVFQRIGYWDTELGAIYGKSRGGEEANICLRIKGGIGHSLILYEPKAIIFHKIIPGRDTLWHLFSYCWDEGFNRAKMRKLTNGYINNPLSTEIIFLRRLLTISIFKRLARFYRVSNLAQIGAIIGSLTCMAITYMIGRVKFS